MPFRSEICIMVGATSFPERSPHLPTRVICPVPHHSTTQIYFIAVYLETRGEEIDQIVY